MKKVLLSALIAVFFLALPSGAQISLLREFAGGAGDGSRPAAAPILSGSTLYGMTRVGGSYDYGTLYKMQDDGSGFAILHHFNWTTGNGANPQGPPVLSGSTLYGVTLYGGTSTYPGGDGTVFKINTDGSDFTILHTFLGGADNGALPTGGLVQSGSTLYGTTMLGGDASKGTIFKVETDGSGFALLHEFSTSDGNSPNGLLLYGTTLYGVTAAGGSSDKGTVFKIETDGGGFSVLHHFAGGTDDGWGPQKLVALADGTLYGATTAGGNSNYGTVFKLGTDGSGFALLHEFAGGANDGAQPYCPPVLSGSYLWGMTYAGGDSNLGTVYQLRTDGSGYAVLHEFAGGADDGATPFAGLLLSGSALVGTTTYGGDSNLGVVFSLPIPPTLTVTSPNGGESWTVGTEQEITWETTGSVGNVDILYSYNDGASWPAIVSYTENDGSFTWTVPDTPSTHCFIRVQENDGDPGDYSDAAFTIVSAVIPPVISGTITCGEAPLAGVVMSGLPGNPLSNPAGFYTSSVDYDWSGTVTPTLAGYLFTPASRSYSNVTGDQTGQDYTAALAPSLELTAPNGWEHWTLGSTKAITWNAVNYTGTVRLVLFKNGVRFGNIVANIPASSGSYSWTVGQTYDSGMAPEGSDYRLYLRSTDNTIVDPSDYRLGLIEPAQLEMTSPNGGESWELGTTQNITWNANGYSGTVRLILFQKAAKVGQIAANLPADQGSYAWTVGTHQAGTAPAGILYSIRLLAGDGSQDDFSDGPLTLIENDSLIVDHHHTQMNAIPSEWLEHAKQHRLLVLGALGNDPVTLGLRLLGSRDARLATASNSNSLGLVLNEGSWLPQGAALDPQEWRWSLERTILDSQATVAIVRPDEGALLAGKLNAESYLQVMSELAERLPQVKLARVTASMDEPNEIMAKFNRQVRESALRNRGILLDTADIESWRNNRQQLVRDVPVRHPAYRAASGVPATDNLTNQGSAAWWLLARLAGWEGEIPLGTNMR